MSVSPTTARSLNLSDREIYVWSVIVRGADSVVAKFEASLSREEITRAAAFRFEHLRRSFLLSRGALRFLIGCYLGVAPKKITLTQGAHGKPSLVQAVGASPGIEFNVSHSGEIAIFAFSSGCELGVDVEQIRPLEEMARVASQFFSREESEDLFSLPPSERKQAFFRCWTRKEAYVKAVGEGLSIPLDSFRVTLRPGEPARLLHLDYDPLLAQAWMLHDLPVSKGDMKSEYAAALAYRDAARPVCLQPLITMEQLLKMG